MDEGEKIADEQAGFRSGYSTTDHVFQKTHAVMKEESVCSFTDYQKALNTVEKKIIYGLAFLPKKTLNIIRSMYQNECMKVLSKSRL